MASWEEAEKRSAEVKAAGGAFMRLAEHGDKFIGAFIGDPHIRDFAWNVKKEQYDPWTAETEAAGQKKVTRYSINVYVVKAGNAKDVKDVPLAEACKIWECNNQVFQDLLKVKAKYAAGGKTGLQVWFFEVERNGKKGDNKTTYSILPETKIDDAHDKIIAGLKLHDLIKAAGDDGDESTDMASHDKAKTNGAAAPAGAAVPAAPATPAAPEVIDPDTATKVIGRLKALPREKVDEFLAKFAIKQIKALKRSDLAAAEAFIGALEAPAAADPFA